MRKRHGAAALILVLFGLTAVNPETGVAAKGGTRDPNPSARATASATIRPSGSPTAAPTASPTPTPSATASPTPKPTASPTAAPTLAAGWPSASFSSTDEALLVNLVNGARTSAGLRTLATDSGLAAIARSRSKDMADRSYFSHTNPDGATVFDLIRESGYCYLSAAENIGWNNYPDDEATQVVFNMFMNSSTHKANLLGTWMSTGVGAYKRSDGNHYWTQVFSVPC
ncbi:MAG TPA: CAP domain-containing protein [Nonomuraea sp.]|nr:CAP domain-containing protein [Nonomuraea sp.]